MIELGMQPRALHRQRRVVGFERERPLGVLERPLPPPAAREKSNRLGMPTGVLGLVGDRLFEQLARVLLPTERPSRPERHLPSPASGLG